MDPQKAFTRITKRVPIEKSILTYRLAARELGCSVNDAKATLEAYFDSDVARERGVGAVWLLSGYLAPAPAASADEMDVDPAAPASTQDGGNEADPVPVKTMRLVQNHDLEAQRALFSPAPSTHLYALVPAAPLASLALLAPSALSLAPPAASARWRPAPDAAPAYGAVMHPDGERPRARAQARPAATATSAKSKAKAPVGKDDDEEEAKPAVSKGKGKRAPTMAEAKKGKKAKDEPAGPKIRPIGQLGGLFSRTFDEPKSTKKKGKAKAASSSSSSPSASEAEDSEGEDVKPQKKSVVPAKRKSTSPVAARKKAPSPLKKKPSVADVVLDGDEDDDWAMDEEALLEAERAAEKQAAAKKTSAGAPPIATDGGGKKGESKAERQKRELEEMMQSDDTMDVDAKPAPAALSRKTSSSSAAAKPKAVSSGNGAAGKAKPKASAGSAQQGLGAFFKKK